MHPDLPGADSPAAARSSFALTSATTLRFVLLAVVATSAVAAIAGWLLPPMLFGAYDNDFVRDVNQCRIDAYEDLGELARSLDNLDILRSDGPFPDRFDADCPSPGRSWAAPLIGVVLFWGVVLIVLWWLPAWRTRRRRYERLGRVAAGGFEAQSPRQQDLISVLADLQQRAGVTVAVTYLRDNLDPRCAALAFGRVGHRCIVLSAGLETLLLRDREAYETIVLHELSHIRNRDVDLGFLTMIAWRVAIPVISLAILGTFGATLAELGARSASGSLYNAVSATQFLVLAVAVVLLRNSVLRNRELVADARVSWLASKDAVGSTLKRYFPNEPRRPKPLWTHPSPDHRIAALSDERMLTVTSFWVWFTVGLITKILTWDLVTLAGDSVLVFTPAAVFVVITFAIEIARSPNVHPGGRDGGTVAVGLGLGLAISTVLFEPGTILLATAAGDSFVIQYLLWIPILCGAAWLAYRWLGAVAAAWRPLLAPDRPRWPKRLSWVALGLAFVPIQAGMYFLVTLPAQSTLAPSLDVDGWLAPFAIIAELPLRLVLFPLPYTAASTVVVIGLLLIPEIARRREQTSPAPSRRERTGLSVGLRTGLFYGIVNPPLLIVVTIALGSLGGWVGGIIAIYATTVVVQVVAAAQVGFRSAHRPHPVGAAALAALVVGVLFIALTVLLAAMASSSPSSSGADDSDLAGVVTVSWYPVMVGVLAGGGAARLLQAVRRKSSARSTTPSYPGSDGSAT